MVRMLERQLEHLKDWPPPVANYRKLFEIPPPPEPNEDRSRVYGLGFRVSDVRYSKLQPGHCVADFFSSAVGQHPHLVQGHGPVLVEVGRLKEAPQGSPPRGGELPHVAVLCRGQERPIDDQDISQKGEPGHEQRQQRQGQSRRLATTWVWLVEGNLPHVTMLRLPY